MTDSLVAFLLARLDDDEHVAQAAGGEEWVGLDVDGFVRARTPDGAFISEVVWTDEVAHIIRHDPVRVLADVAAKRAIVKLALHVGLVSESDLLYAVVAALASAWSDHPDFDERWKP